MITNQSVIIIVISIILLTSGVIEPKYIGILLIGTGIYYTQTSKLSNKKKSIQREASPTYMYGNQIPYEVNYPMQKPFLTIQKKIKLLKNIHKKTYKELVFLLKQMNSLYFQLEEDKFFHYQIFDSLLDIKEQISTLMDSIKLPNSTYLDKTIDQIKEEVITSLNEFITTQQKKKRKHIQGYSNGPSYDVNEPMPVVLK